MILIRKPLDVLGCHHTEKVDTKLTLSFTIIESGDELLQTAVSPVLATLVINSDL
jgi:hypothetical protein